MFIYIENPDPEDMGKFVERISSMLTFSQVKPTEIEEHIDNPLYLPGSVTGFPKLPEIAKYARETKEIRAFLHKSCKGELLK